MHSSAYHLNLNLPQVPHMFVMGHRCKHIQGISDFFLNSYQRRPREKVGGFKVRVDTLEVMLLLTVANIRVDARACRHVQGDQSGCSLGVFDNETKVAF